VTNNTNRQHILQDAAIRYALLAVTISSLGGSGHASSLAHSCKLIPCRTAHSIAPHLGQTAPGMASITFTLT
jgi:hypothetical protein